MTEKAYFITTPIYYVNNAPHVGNAYTTIMSDALARYQKLKGREVFFLTGTDENAPKVAAAARENGLAPGAYVDQIAEQFKDVWRSLEIEYSDFIRTTEPRHVKVVQSIFTRLLEQADIYKGSYEGWYCVPCETFWNEGDLKEGKCPNPECGRPVEWVSEENYYFRLSAFSQRLLDHIESHPDFMLPEFRKNEVVSFIRQGLRDVSITRSNQGWGIEVPGDPGKVIYVWFDALINYISALGYHPETNSFENPCWPADFQAMAKDIFVRFHCTFWPAMLLALGLELPRTFFGHGYWTVNGEKISKSKGNAISPAKLAEDLAAESGPSKELAMDAIRYFLAREVTFGLDGDFSIAQLKHRFNSDLANDLGNLLNRTLSMLGKYFNNVVPDPGSHGGRLAGVIVAAAGHAEEAYDRFDFSQALEAIWQMIGAGNKFVNDSKPWELEKQGRREELAGVIYSALEAARAAAIMVSPVMPSAAKEIIRQLGLGDGMKLTWAGITESGAIPVGTEALGPSPMFPRLTLTLPSPSGRGEGEGPKAKGETKVETEQSVPVAAPVAPEDTISYDYFSKLKIRVAEVLRAERVPGADKLLKLAVSLGDEERQIVAGIAQWYTPEDLVGKKIVLLANLEPAKIRGVVSNGMLLAADVDGRAIVLTPDSDVPAGSKVR